MHAIVEALTGEPERPTVTLRVPRNAIARKIVQLVKATGGRVEELRKGTTERRPSYRLRLVLPANAASADLCCARAALRGAFVARGTVGDPAAGYHFEVAVVPGSWDGLRRSIARLGLPLRTVSRRGRVIWYLKGADAIRRVLGLMGASRAQPGEPPRQQRDRQPPETPSLGAGPGQADPGAAPVGPAAARSASYGPRSSRAAPGPPPVGPPGAGVSGAREQVGHGRAAAPPDAGSRRQRGADPAETAARLTSSG
ncbi:MAG: DNA-binding protein WhiA [Chloroflexi bacterium]|nr:MAG: DNA-binding protein WhiA [Chloroflexota bacterium]